MSGTDILDTVFSSGQNEGIERSILPLPQLARVVNARQRKRGRWGKRYGTAALATQNSSGNTIGNGAGAARCIGAGFAIVDDRCAVFDQQAATWIDPKTLQAANTASPICQSPRVAGAVSGWLPDVSYYPVPPLASQYQQTTPCAQTYGLGYLWSAITFIDVSQPATPDQIIRVVATNPTDQSLVFSQDFVAGTAAQGGNIFPRLVTCGSTIVLTYITRPTNAAATVMARNLTSLAAGFAAEVDLVTPAATVPLGPGGVHDASTYSATQFVAAFGSTAGVSPRAYLFNASTLLVASSARFGPGVSAIGISVVGAFSAHVYLTVSSAAATTVTVFVINSSTAVGTVTIDAAEPATYTAYATMLPSGDVRVVFGYFGDVGTVPRHFSWRDVTGAATLASALVGRQYRFQPISRPVTIGTQVYVWVSDPDITSGFGYATLLRLPALTEYKALSGTTNSLSCPLEMSPQDFLIRTTVPSPWNILTGAGVPPVLCLPANGLSAVVRLGTSATYAFLAPTLLSVPDLTVPFSHEFRCIQARHYTGIASARSLGQVATDRATFVPVGVLTRVDERGATEEGFVLRPVVLPPITKSGGAGAMSPSVTYKYAAIYKSRNEFGRFEVSAPGPVASIVMGAGDSETFLNFLPLSVTARASVQIEIYRTLGNGTAFYYVDAISGGASDGAVCAYNDRLADSVISGHAVLYTQVGQTLPNTLPPPARIALAGGQRVLLAGLLRSDVIHASKLILGDQSPSWADSDSFRIVMPSTVTGLAWMDNLLVLTDEGAYVVSGDGPDDSGNGEFSPPVRLPFALGCIEPRSVITVDEGTFFQTPRGLYMVPRGFGSPVAAGDNVMDTLRTFPVITATAALTKASEQTIRWSCMDPLTNNGALVVYDLVNKTWSVDLVSDPIFGGTSLGLCSAGSWLGGETAMIADGPVLLATNSTFSDSTFPIAMQLRTGDIRPFGNMSEGVVSKVNLMAELRANCTLQTTKATEWGTSPASSRVFASVAGDTQVGQITYVETELGGAELRDAVALSVQWDESSTTEGIAFIASAVEHEQSEGLKRVSSLARGT